MEIGFGRELREKLIQLGVAMPNEISGCNPDEIEEVCVAQGVAHLPKLYYEFLLVMGRGAGRLFIGSDCYYPTLLRLKVWANELLVENHYPFELPADSVVFFMHQGYAFFYFRVSDGDDPPIYFYTEGLDFRSKHQTPEMTEDNLSKFLTQFIRQRESYAAQVRFLSKWKAGE